MTHARFARSIVALAVLLVVGALSGCESTGSSAGTSTILHQWGDRIGQLGYVVIVPPQEDVRVGDIYAFAISPDELGSSSATARPR